MRSLAWYFIGMIFSGLGSLMAWLLIQESQAPVLLVVLIVALFNYTVGLLVMLNLTLIKGTKNE